MVRELLLRLPVLLLLALFGAYAWLTRHPDAPVLERAQDWPLVGPLAERFRDFYQVDAREAARRGSNGAGGSAADALEARRRRPEATAPEVEWVIDYERLDARPWVWVSEGTPLLAAPDPGAPVVHEVEVIANLPLLERKGDWYRLRRGDVVGWASLPDYDDPSTPMLGSAPEPVLPLPGRPPDPDRLAAGRALLADRERIGWLGPYRLYTDVEDARLIALCDRVVAGLETVFRERYGLRLLGEAQEVVLLFADYGAFRTYRQGSSLPHPEQSVDFAGPGFVALHADGRTADEVVSVLVHELTHLLSRRGLGPALPLWLAEGLADDLGGSRVAADGTLLPGTLGGRSWTDGGSWSRSGAMAEAGRLQRELERRTLPSLQTLVEMPPEEFYAPGSRSLHYAASAFWVRYFLDGRDPALAAGFRSFLGAVAAGDRIDGELLRSHLDRPWETLDEGFGRWLAVRVLEPPAARQAASRPVG